MKNEQLVATLDALITKIDNALDEIADTKTPETEKAATILMHVTMDLNVLIDDIIDSMHPVSGAV
jgi:prefoldin subunit 5